MHREGNTRRTEKKRFRHQRKKIKKTSSDQMGSREKATQKAKLIIPTKRRKNSGRREWGGNFNE